MVNNRVVIIIEANRYHPPITSLAFHLSSPLALKNFMLVGGGCFIILLFSEKSCNSSCGNEAVRVFSGEHWEDFFYDRFVIVLF